MHAIGARKRRRINSGKAKRRDTEKDPRRGPDILFARPFLWSLNKDPSKVRKELLRKGRSNECHLVAGQLSALTGLGTLRHLDLDLVRVGQVVGGHSKAPGRHLSHKAKENCLSAGGVVLYAEFVLYLPARFLL
jgi:hypothetical protein